MAWRGENGRYDRKDSTTTSVITIYPKLNQRFLALLEGDNSVACRISAEVNVGTQNSKYSRIINFE